MTVSTNNYQIGQSAVPSQNFHLTTPAVPDGTLKLYRGNVGAPTGAAILDADATGRVSFPAEGAWTSQVTGGVSPSIGTINDANVVWRYRILGKTVFFFAQVNIVDNGSGSGALRITPPFSCVGGFVGGRANNVTGKMVQGVFGGGLISIFTYDNLYPASTGESIALSGVFELA